jgi:hypothetical protein
MLSVEARNKPSSPAAARRPLDEETASSDEDVGGRALALHFMGS